jgi:hypothetical protein
MESGEDEELPKFSGSKASVAYLYPLASGAYAPLVWRSNPYFLFKVPAESCFFRFLVGSFSESWIIIRIHNCLEVIYMQVKMWTILFINAR